MTDDFANMTDLLPWLSFGLLGAYHGINPGMGWLFAVALGLQERSRSAVIRAFGPIVAGHAASVAVVVAAVGAAQLWVSPDVLRLAGAGVLVAFGLYKLLAPLSHPRWVGMRVSPADLAVWSFLMATAHGAGLMLVPVLLGLQAGSEAHAAHLDNGAYATLLSGGAGTVLQDLAAIAVHTTAMFLAMAAVALVVFEKVGLAILRRAWFNLDRVWAGTLIATGLVTLVL